MCSRVIGHRYRCVGGVLSADRTGLDLSFICGFQRSRGSLWLNCVRVNLTNRDFSINFHGWHYSGSLHEWDRACGKARHWFATTYCYWHTLDCPVALWQAYYTTVSWRTSVSRIVSMDSDAFTHTHISDWDRCWESFTVIVVNLRYFYFNITLNS